MDSLVQKIREMIQPILDENGFYLVDIVLRGQHGSRVLSVYADTKTGIMLDQIAFLTREINDILDSQDMIEGAYRLDVSSPGVDHDLHALWEFEKNIGRNLRVNYEIDAEPLSVTGQLVSVENNQLLIKDKKEKIVIPMNAISKARVHLKW